MIVSIAGFTVYFDVLTPLFISVVILRFVHFMAKGARKVEQEDLED